MELNKIYNMDCIEGMKQMEDESVTITVTSPPYNIDGDKYLNYTDNLTTDQYYEFLKKVINECIRVTKYYTFFNIQLIRDNKKALLKILYEYTDNIKEIIIWDKIGAPTGITPTMLGPSFEFVIVFTKKTLAENRSFEYANFNNWEGNTQQNIIHTPNMNGNKELGNPTIEHHAVFPQNFVKWFIKNFTKEGDTILDPFAGTGTTGLVSKYMNRKWIGFDTDKNYADYANKRINELTTLEVKNGETLYNFI